MDEDSETELEYSNQSLVHYQCLPRKLCREAASQDGHRVTQISHLNRIVSK